MIAAATHRYGGVAQFFHWLIVILILAMYALGWTMTDLAPTDPEKFRLYQIHKSIGITIFALAALRLVWRFGHRPPPWPETMSTWERLAAAGAHWALYALLFILPLIGVLQSNAANFPIVFWGGYELPALIGQNEAIGERLLSLHHLLANALAGLILLHAAAAIRHHVMLKDDVLRRMIPSASAGVAAVALALALLLPPFVLSESERASQAETGAGAQEEASVAETAAADADEGDPATGEVWTVEEGSELGFIARQQGSEVKGGFEDFDARIVFDPDDLENSRLDVDIDVATIATGHSDRDKTLKSPSFFDVDKWPSAAFESRDIVQAGEGRYEANGTLTIRDVTKDVTLPFDLEIEPDPDDPDRQRAHATGELLIKRLDYGVGQGDWASTGTVADEVVITVDIKASRPS